MVSLAVGLGCRNLRLASLIAALPALLHHHLQNLGAFKASPSGHGLPSAASSFDVRCRCLAALEIRSPFDAVLSPCPSGVRYLRGLRTTRGPTAASDGRSLQGLARHSRQQGRLLHPYLLPSLSQVVGYLRS